MRALTDCKKGLGQLWTAGEITEEALEFLADISGGDARAGAECY